MFSTRKTAKIHPYYQVAKVFDQYGKVFKVEFLEDFEIKKK